MAAARYRITYTDLITAQVILVQVSEYPDYRALMPDIPVSIQCEEIAPPVQIPVQYKAAA